MAIRTCRRACDLAMRLLTVAYVAMVLSGSAAHATVIIDGTRVIYPGDRREVSVSLHNVGDLPALVEVWIDAGNDKSLPNDTSAPIVATPPLFRVNPAQGQTLRLIYTQAALPADRESVFWLNVLDIPPREKANPDAPNHLEMAFRHRLKIFYRPAGMKGDPAAAAKAVVWTVAHGAEGSALIARNPTPFFISLVSADVTAGAMQDHAHTDMLPPQSSTRLALSRADFHGSATVKYSFINDFGSVVNGSAIADAAP